MLSRMKLITAIVTGLMLFVSWSACCCQSDWVVRAGVRVLVGAEGGGSAEAGCPCCNEVNGHRTPDNRCPLDGGDCSPSVAKTTPTPPVEAPLLSPVAWTWVAWLEPAGRTSWFGSAPLARPVHGCFDATLLGLGCALVV